MNRRSLGIALMVAGGIAVVIALIGMLTSGSKEASPPTTNAAVTSTASVASTPVTASSTTASVTTTAASSTTTTGSPTTTEAPTIDPSAAITAFVGEFAALIDAGDTDGLLDRLHPAVLDTQDADLCRSFIEREILALVDYRLTGDITGPVATRFGEEEVDVYTAPVAFTFQGTEFDGEASFALRDGQVRWFTTCR